MNEINRGVARLKSNAHDVTWMHESRVRKGSERYGGAAFFDDKCQSTGIYASHLDKMFDVRDGMMHHVKYAKYVWFTSAPNQNYKGRILNDDAKSVGVDAM